jgi:hypothetical protein
MPCSCKVVVQIGLYGLGLALRRPGRNKPTSDHAATPLKTKIEQMLTEARVIIPGGQALLGFQFVCTFNRSFKELPLPIQYVHAASLCAVALAVLLLMTPAALHRIAFHGEDDKSFFRIGSALVVAASIPLASGAGNIAVVFFKVTENMFDALVSGCVAVRSAWRVVGLPCLAPAEFGGRRMITIGQAEPSS